MGSALITFIGTIIVFTIIQLFMKSGKKKLAESQEKIIFQENPNIKDVVALLIRMEDEDADDEKLKYINLINIDTIELSDELSEIESKFYLFYKKSAILIGKNRYTEAKPLIENLIRFIESQDGHFESYSGESISVIFLHYSIIKYIEGNDNDSEHYHSLANESYGEELILDYQKFDTFKK